MPVVHRNEVLPTAVLAGTFLMHLLFAQGCADGSGPGVIAGGKTTVVLGSNLDGTRYRYREYKEFSAPDERWAEANSSGRSVAIEVYSNLRYEIEASARGYRPKRIKVTEPDKRQDFEFLEDDKDGSRVDPPPPPPPPPPPLGPVKQRLAVIIGIGKYEKQGTWNLTNLNYAAKDAQDLAERLKNAGPGRFDKVILLTDDQATTMNIRKAIREDLRKVQEVDLVLVYWAGHGSPDPRDVKSLYLVTYDTDPEHMASTAYAMNDFQTDIGRIESRRVMVLADTCHAAGISDPRIALRGPKDNTIVEGLRGTYLPGDGNKSAPATSFGTDSPIHLIFTSCEQGEFSREDKTLGHGVFTHYLLKALAGEADKTEHGGNADGNVTLGETIEYVRDQVKRFTENQQHPATAGQFDRNLPLGKTR